MPSEARGVLTEAEIAENRRRLLARDKKGSRNE